MLHLSTYGGSGGAAIAALRISKALNEIGVESQFACLHSDTSNEMIAPLRRNMGFRKTISSFRTYIENLFVRFQRGSRRGQMSMGTDSILDHRYLDAMIGQYNPDVIHLHWINHGFLNIEDIPKLGRPIVWTFHDMWPILGVKHYSSNPAYKDGFLGQSELTSIDRKTWLRKKEAWQEMIPKTVAVLPKYMDAALSNRKFSLEASENRSNRQRH